MITIDKFYFNPAEVEISVSAGKRPGNYHLAFVAEGTDGITIEISTLDRKTFKTLIEQITSMGNTILLEEDDEDE